jgi:AraC-like DNA-binding protein
VTGTTPHQYLLRTRLRAAATRLISGTERILDVALDAGFGDMSNFSRAFRTEFGVSPPRFPSLSASVNGDVHEAGGSLER